MTDISADFDLRYNYLALLLAITGSKYYTPDKASIATTGFGIAGVDKKRNTWTPEDAKEMDRLRKQGKTWGEIGEIFNTDGQVAYKVWSRGKEKVVCPK